MTAPDAPTAMTLEEALQVAKANAWDVMFESGGFVGIARTDGKGGIAFAEGWDVAFSAALGYPVVKRDDTAELVEAAEQVMDSVWDDLSELWLVERHDMDALRAALARYRGES